MSAKEIEYEIRDVAGVAHATIKLRPGINVLLSRNAGGKTSAIRAITRAQGGDEDLERRDGSEFGSVTGPGVTLRIGKVTKRTGEAELSLADVSPLSTVIDPGFSDSDANARARVRALIDLLGLRVDDAAIETLASGDTDLLAWLRDTVQGESIDDLTVAAEKLRHYAHGLARSQEQRAEAAKGAAQAATDRCAIALKAVGGEAHLSEQTIEAARAALVEGSRSYERSVAQCEGREALETRQAEIREAIGERPDSTEEECSLIDDEADLQNTQDEIANLEAQLAAARETRAAQVAKIQARRDGIAERLSAAARWDEQQAVLEKSVEGPTRDELAILRTERVDGATAALEIATWSAEYRTAEAERLEANRVRERADIEASRLRAIATGISGRLGEIMARAGAHGLSVIDGRLHAEIDGEVKDFERRLSEGQRVRAVLDVAAQVYPHQVVPIAGGYWQALDPTAQRELAQLAAERGLYAVTEKPSEGELRVDHVGEAQAEAAAS